MSRTKNPPKPAANQRFQRGTTPKGDYLWDAALDNYDHIQRAYRIFEDKKPVMLFDVQEQLLHAHLYEEFRHDINERSRAILREQYEQAQKKNQIVLFVRDNERRKLVSFSLDRK